MFELKLQDHYVEEVIDPATGYTSYRLVFEIEGKAIELEAGNWNDAIKESEILMRGKYDR